MAFFVAVPQLVRGPLQRNLRGKSMVQVHPVTPLIKVISMSKGVNKVILLGTLGKDPECKIVGNGTHVANISMATSEKFKDKTGEYVEKTEWHNVTFFGKLAEVVGGYLIKGSQCYVEGKLTTEKWQDKDTGKDRFATKIIASSMQMLGGKGNKESKSEITYAQDDGIPY